MLSLLQEGNRRPDLTIKDMRYEGLSTVGLRLLQLSQQFMGSVEDVGGQRLLQLAVQSLGMPEGRDAAEKNAARFFPGATIFPAFSKTFRATLADRQARSEARDRDLRGLRCAQSQSNFAVGRDFW